MNLSADDLERIVEEFQPKAHATALGLLRRDRIYCFELNRQRWPDGRWYMLDRSYELWRGHRIAFDRSELVAVGVEYGTAANAGKVCRAFDFSRRREKLSFTHHAEVCAIPDPKVQDRLLDWASEGDKPKSTRDLRDAVRQYLDEQGWTDEDRAR